MKKYKQLTLGLRYQIFAYKQENYSISKIAKVLGYNKSTISRELKRNTKDGYYSPEYAQIEATSRDKNKRTNKKLTNKIKLLISFGKAPHIFFVILENNKKLTILSPTE